MKALKLAAIYAVGINHYKPVIDRESALWATELVVAQTRALIAKFENDEVGEQAGNESKQHKEIIRIMAQFCHEPYEANEKYGGSSWEMHRDGVVTITYLSRRLIKLACFKHDKIGATNALNRALKLLLESAEIKEMPPQQMQLKYGKSPRAFVMADLARFFAALKGGVG